MPASSPAVPRNWSPPLTRACGSRQRSEAIELIDGSDDPAALPRMISALVFALWGHDTLDLQRQLTTRAVDLATKAADPSLEFSAHRARYYVAVESADAASARASLRRMQEIADEIGEPRMAWNCAVFEGFEAIMEARFADAEQASGRALEIGTEIGEPARVHVVRRTAVHESVVRRTLRRGHPTPGGRRSPRTPTRSRSGSPTPSAAQWWDAKRTRGPSSTREPWPGSARCRSTTSG